MHSIPSISSRVSLITKEGSCTEEVSRNNPWLWKKGHIIETYDDGA